MDCYWRLTDRTIASSNLASVKAGLADFPGPLLAALHGLDHAGQSHFTEDQHLRGQWLAVRR
jgi:hypothetical protein